MKKVARAFLALAVPAAFLAGCSLSSPGEPEWAVGYWSTVAAPFPYAAVVHLQDDGTAVRYADYACTEAEASGTWSASGDSVTIYLEGTWVEYERVYDQEGRDVMTSDRGALYRKGAEPQREPNLSAAVPLPVADAWTGGSLNADGYRLYSFHAEEGSGYTVDWLDWWIDPDSYGCDIKVSCFDDGFANVYFEAYDDPFSSGDANPFLALKTGTVYLLVCGIPPEEVGTFVIKVH